MTYQKKTSMIYRPGRKTVSLRLSTALVSAMRDLGVDLNRLIEDAMIKELIASQRDK